MSKYLLRSLAAAAVLSAAVAGTASANTVWNFASLAGSSNANTSLGATYTFNQSGAWLMAAAVIPSWTVSNGSCSSAQPCLFDKVLTGDPSETGLGLTPNVNNEIYNPDGIALTSSPGLHLSGLEIGSVQTGESWAVVGCSATYGSCTTIDSGIGGTAGSTVSITDLSPYASYIVYVPCANSSSCMNSTTDGSNNIVLMSATTVPEPGTLAFMAAGLFGLGWIIRRRRSN